MNNQSEHTSYDIIAIFDHSQANGQSGIVKILFYYDPEISGRILPANPEIFKYGKCWISSGYAELESTIPIHSPFLVRNVERTDHYEDGTINAEPRVDWWGKGHAAEAFNDSSFVPVFKGDLPSLEYGILKQMDVFGFTRIMILNEDVLYGPFDITVLEDHSLQAASSTMALNLFSDHVMKISFLTVRETDVFVKPPVEYSLPIEGFITSLSDFKREFRGGWETLDYIGNDRLVRYIAALKPSGATKPLMTKKDAGTVAAEIRAYLNSKQGKQNDPARLTRAVMLLEELDSSTKENQNTYDTFIECFLDSANGKNVVERWAEANSVKFGEGKAVSGENNKDVENERHKLNKDIARLSSKRDDLRDQIKTDEEELAQSQQRSADMEAAEIQNKAELQVDSLRSELEELNGSIELRRAESIDLEGKFIELQEKYNLAKEISNSKARIDLLREDERELKQVVDELQNEVGNPNLGVKIASLKRMIGWLHSGTSDIQVEASHKYKAPSLLSLKSQDKSSMMDVMHTISDRLSSEASGRPFSEAEVANLMICTQQNFLTILHGRPGVGKTSSAIRMASAMGLDEDDHSDNFLNIAVGRGWMSTRDLIGFYNSLKNVYQPARTGLYEFLKQGTSEEASKTLRLVLLDEANLSPLEHYWSDFIGLCDQEGYQRAISTGIPGDRGSLRVNMNRNLRFIATINNDSTTEPISPRLLDRAPVISMDFPDSNTINSGFIIEEMTGTLPLSFLEKNLGTISKSADSASDAGEERISDATLLEMIAIASERDSKRGEPIELSPRREAAIQRYVSTATIYMEGRLATDFAIAQFILPLINGDHEGFVERLNAMETCAKKNRLSRSKEIINRIISRGNSYLNSYSFL